MSTRIPREKAVFVEAVEIADPEQRRQFLDQACGTDQALREQVEKLLTLSQRAGDFFQECAPALEAAAGDADRVLSAAESALDPEPLETKRIGPYKLLQKLGEGGYGVVYMAEQEQPIRRRVALKIIKLGMDTKNVIARFEAERQALALMDHPNIARVLDAGATETGRPLLCDGTGLWGQDYRLLRPEPGEHAGTAGALHPGLQRGPARSSEGDHPPGP